MPPECEAFSQKIRHPDAAMACDLQGCRGGVGSVVSGRDFPQKKQNTKNLRAAIMRLPPDASPPTRSPVAAAARLSRSKVGREEQ